MPRPQTRRFGFVDFDAMGSLPSSDDADQFVCRRANGDNVLVTRADIIAGLGGGNVFISGAPANNRVAIWVDGTAIEGTTALEFNGTVLTTTGGYEIQNNGGEYKFQSTNRAALLNVAAAFGVPTVVVRFSDLNTGLSSGALDAMGLTAGGLDCIRIAEVGGARQVGFYVTAPISLQTGVAVTDAAIHAALVALGLFTA